MTRRLFFALLPDAPASDQIIAVQQQLTADNLRIYSPENLHQTLVFLGELTESKLMELIRACASVYLAPITMQFDDLVFWPKPKVLCLLAKIVPRDVLNLVHQLQAISEPFGIALEKRPYRPHITLARKANQPVVLNFTPISFTANEFVLMQSMRTDSGPGYEILYRWPLNGTL